MRIIRWLHFSDIHLNSDETATRMMRQALPVYLRELNQQIDYAFFTGDISDARNGFVNADIAVSFLRDIMSSAAIPIDRLFIVPGNHDVNRNTTDRENAIKRVCIKKEAYYTSSEGIIAPDDLAVFRSSEEHFRGITDKVYVDAPKRGAQYHQKNPHFIVETEELVILHLDTTLVKTEANAPNLIVGTALVLDCLECICKSKPAIVISHFPIEFLRQDEEKTLSSILQSHNIRLWLSGHEHDFHLMPREYLHSLQCGNLRYENGSRATILIGELNLDTGRGSVKAHVWFENDGWAIYPILWKDGLPHKRNTYSFDIGITSDAGERMSREVLLSKEANDTYLTPGEKFASTEFSEEILPDLICDGQLYSSDSDTYASIDILHRIWHTNFPHSILYREGGIGKSTTLYYTAKEIIEREQRPVVYISLERLRSDGHTIEEYFTRALVGIDNETESLAILTSERHSVPNAYLFIDGLNEVAPRDIENYIREIKKLSRYSGIQIVLSSRENNLTRYNMQHYVPIQVSGLRIEQITSRLGSKSKETIKNDSVLLRLLRNPLMLLLYQEASPIKRQYSDVEFLDWVRHVTTTTDIIKNYYTSQVALSLSRTAPSGEHVLIYAIIVNTVLPLVGYRLEIQSTTMMDVLSYEELLPLMIEETELVIKSAPLQLRLIMRRYGVALTQSLNDLQVHNILCKELCLLQSDDKSVSIQHQVLRDYLAAAYIHSKIDDKTVILEIIGTRKISGLVMEHLRGLGGRYWEKGQSGGPGDAIKLSEYVKGKSDARARMFIHNLLACYTEEGGTPNYSGLYLREEKLPVFRDVQSAVSLSGAKLSAYTVGLDYSTVLRYTLPTFSDDDRLLAVIEGKRLCIFSLVSGEKQFLEPNLERLLALRFSASGRYMFAISCNHNHRIHVWKYEDDEKWSYLGNSEIYTKTLRAIVWSEKLKMLYLYHNNREVRISIPSCKRIYNRQHPHPYEHMTDGDGIFLDVRNRHQFRKTKTHIPNHDGSLVAICDESGQFLVQNSDKRVVYRFAEGTRRLKDASISGNGKRAATLSEPRPFCTQKIALWDLDVKRKIREYYSTEELEKIHLSDSGKWIICESKSDVCARLWDDWSVGFSIPYRLVSNQRGRITSYSDSVLIESNDGLINHFDLNTKEASNIAFPSKNVILAAITPGDSLIVVRKNGYTVETKNSRTGMITHNLNSDNTPVLGVTAMVNQPFVAVATANGIVSIYHTGDELRKRKLNPPFGNQIIVMHPIDDVIASGGGAQFGTNNYWTRPGTNHGQWYYNPSEYKVMGIILDLAFNIENNELVAISSDGQIMFSHAMYCKPHRLTNVIISFDVSQYDFKEAIIDDKIRNELIANGVNL